MSSVVAWVGVDSRGPSSFYIAGDSRVSWPGSSVSWDLGRKVFAATRHADIFGYCGDVTFPALVLGQVCAATDSGLLFQKVSSATERHFTLRSMIEEAFVAYPVSQRKEMVFLHASREGEGMKSRFILWETKWTEAGSWTDRELPLPGGFCAGARCGIWSRSRRGIGIKNG